MPTIVLSCSRDPDAPCHAVFALRQAGWCDRIAVVRPGSARIGHTDVVGLVLAGGVDIEPHHWDHTRTVRPTAPVDADRDAIELALAGAAWTRGVPILGLCRGSQLLAVARGGTLHADIAEASGVDVDAHQHGDAYTPSLRHRVSMRARTRLAAVLGATDVAVNSRHHQAVCNPGDGLVAVAHEPATAMPDGALIEAIEAADPGRWALGVQWHPENLVRRGDGAGLAARALFAHFVAAARVSAAERRDRDDAFVELRRSA